MFAAISHLVHSGMVVFMLTLDSSQAYLSALISDILAQMGYDIGLTLQ